MKKFSNIYIPRNWKNHGSGLAGNPILELKSHLQFKSLSQSDDGIKVSDSERSNKLKVLSKILVYDIWYMIESIFTVQFRKV